MDSIFSKPLVTSFNEIKARNFEKGPDTVGIHEEVTYHNNGFLKHNGKTMNYCF